METKTTQCDSCAFLHIEDQSTYENDRNVEAKFVALRGTVNSPQKPRHIFVGGNGDRSETCFVDSSIFKRDRKTVHCSEHIDNALSLSEAVTLRESRSANSLARSANLTARDARIWAIIATIIATIAIAFPYIMKVSAN